VTHTGEHFVQSVLREASLQPDNINCVGEYADPSVMGPRKEVSKLPYKLSLASFDAVGLLVMPALKPSQ